VRLDIRAVGLVAGGPVCHRAQDSFTPVSETDVLGDPAAGRRAIRGGGLRVAGYGAGAVLTAATSVLLLRYLSVEDFGAYVTVAALVAIVAGITEAGLGLVAQREWVNAPDTEERRRIVGSVVGIRLVITPIGVGAALGFGVLAGYDGSLLAGIALAGAGLIVANVAASLTVPLGAQLRFGAITAADLARQLAIMIVIVVVVVAGGGLAALFLSHIVGGVAMLVVTAAFLGGAALVGPTFSWERWKPLVVAAAPVAAAAVVNVVYLRLLVLLMSLVGDPTETGLFATSYRVLEVFAGVPGLMMSAAFPILAYAGAGDESRLAYAIQRMVEAGLLVSGLIVLVLIAAAEPIIVLLGGDEYRDAAGVLQIQAVALVGAFLTQVWALGLVAVHRQAALIVVNIVALATALAGGLALIPVMGEDGAALAAVIGEFVLAATCAVMLVRARPALRPQGGRPLKLVAAGVLGFAAGLVPGIPDVAAAALSASVFLIAAWLLRAIPAELVEALQRYRGAP
jgi:O-antigen/teichoic acid export membrane protein